MAKRLSASRNMIMKYNSTQQNIDKSLSLM